MSYDIALWLIREHLLLQNVFQTLNMCGNCKKWPFSFLPPKTLKFYDKLREVSFSNCHKFANICSFSFILHACLVFLKYALYYWKSEILQRRKHKKNIWLFSIFSSPLTHCNLLNSWLGILIQWIDW